MEVFICGAEPIVPETMERFTAHYERAGLRPGAIVPAYGLAEATLAVTFTPHSRGMRCDAVDHAALSTERRAAPVASGGLRVPSCGVAMPGLDLRVADGSGRPVEERGIGEVQVRGPSITSGYINDPDATRASRTPDGWLRTGDLGYLAGGELHVCGREKDVIVIRGRNLHAHDLEAVAGRVEGVRAGHAVALGVQFEGEGERLVVIAESRQYERPERIADAIRRELDLTINAVPHEVCVVPPGAIPKTSSGKLKRIATRELYLRDGLVRQRKDQQPPARGDRT
jgi:fatty-acyl-CoA synthase